MPVLGQGNGRHAVSLWLQAAIGALHDREYQRMRRDLLPICPIPVPGCLVRELEFGERSCADPSTAKLFPIRFLWTLEANEQNLFGLAPLAHSRYHPEKLLQLWKKARADPDYRSEREAEGFVFDFAERAVELSVGWVYIGERFAEDFLEVEAALGVELLFPAARSKQRRPAFRALKRQRSGGIEGGEQGAAEGSDK